MSAVMDSALHAFPMLGRHVNQVAGSLSGGQQQMLALARSYLSNPAVILIDEASMGLAPVVVDALFDFMARLSGALLIVEQYIHRVLPLTQSAYILESGSIVHSGPSDELDAREVFDRYLSIEV